MLVSCRNGLTQPVKVLEEHNTELDVIYQRIENNEEMGKIIDLSKSQIYKYYEGKTVLVTGATGFLGRGLVEKLLRACPIKKVLIVLRPKKKESMEERGKKIFEGVLFDKMKELNPRWEEQVEFIGGEALKECFGFTEETQAKIRSEVDIIFHEAATVRFDEELDFSLRVNVVGTIELIKVAKTCPNLEAFVHVSTAYSHAYMFNSEEKYYPTPINIEQMFEFLSIDDPELKRVRTKEILSQWKIDCMYTLTKALAENYIRDYCQGLPIAIFKPSIVSSTYREPILNWTDAYSGINPYFVGCALGMVHVGLADLDCILDLIPLDMSTNETLAIAWDIAQLYKKNRVVLEPPLYNFASGVDNGRSWQQFNDLAIPQGFNYPPSRPLYYYFEIRTKYRPVFFFLDFFLHFLPAVMADVYLRLKGKKPRLLDFYIKVQKFHNLTFFFSSHEWRFDTTRSRSLWDKMTPEDQELFFCDVRKLDWDNYMWKYWNGLRCYLMNDPMDNVEEARKKFFKLKLVHYFVTTLFGMGLLYILFKLLSFLFNAIF